MLTHDLVRARLRGGEVRPLYVDAKSSAELARAEGLIALFSTHVGAPRGALDDALAEAVGEGTDYLLHRGLAKLLFDRCEVGTEAAHDPIALRQRVFEAARAHHPVAQREGEALHPVTRAQVLTRVGEALGLSLAQVEHALYADLEREQVVRSFEPLTPAQLLNRYNLALVQAVLLRASALTLRIAACDPKRLRQLFRFIKFYRLIHTATGDWASGYEITLDGPASLFSQSSKYGVQLAEFLPALLLCKGWSLRAHLLWGRDRRAAELVLDDSCGLVSHYPDRGAWITDEERGLITRFEALGSPWEIEQRAELIDLGGRGVLVPDLVFRHRDDGRCALLEIVGFWRRGYLESRLELLRAHGPPNLILAVSKKLCGAREALGELPGEISVFSDIIRARDVLERVERVARRP